ncbi:MAG: tetratricopeptide repeat protein [Blastocatellia bacterium]|nr:tetratricopeptide repeat protein [Blastocatellia bacterium]
MSFFSSGYSKEKCQKAAEKFIAQGRLDLAIKEYEKILKEEPNDLKTVSAQAELLSRNNQNRDAIPLFQKIADHYRKTGQMPQAIAMYRRVYKMDPTNFAVAVSAADLCKSQGQTADAVQFYLSAGSASRRNNQLPTAIKMIKEAIDLDPKFTKARVELAQMYHLTGMVDESHEIYISAGQEFLQKGQNAEALECYRRAIVVKPGSKPALKAITDFSLQSGDVKGAVRMLNQLLQTNPKDGDLLILLGRTCLQANLLDDAESAFSRLFEIDPVRFDYLLEVGKKFLQQGNYERPTAIVETCFDYVLNRGQKKKLTAILKEVVQNTTDKMPALQMLAEIYARVSEKRNLASTLNLIVQVANQQGQPEEARKALQKLVELSPKNKNYQEQLARLGVEVAPTAETEEDETEDVLDQYNYSTELLESMVQQNPMFLQMRIKMLEDMVASQPDYIEVRQQLKQNYVESGQLEKAAQMCLEIASIQQNRGNDAASQAAREEAHSLNPALRMSAPLPELPYGFEIPDTGVPESAVPPLPDDGPSGELSMGFTLPDDFSVEIPMATVQAAIVEQAGIMGFGGKIVEITSPQQFQQFVGKSWLRPMFSNSLFSVIKVGVDNFGDDHVKNFQVRQSYLLPISEIIEDELKNPNYHIAYVGNSEFLCLIPQAETEDAAILAEGMRARVESLWLPHPESELLEWITASFAIVTAIPSQAAIMAVVAALDATLNHAHSQGGNQIVVYAPHG